MNVNLAGKEISVRVVLLYLIDLIMNVFKFRRSSFDVGNRTIIVLNALSLKINQKSSMFVVGEVVSKT